MAVINLTIPDGDISAALAAAADEWLDNRKVSRAGLTEAQRIQKFWVGVFKEVYIQSKVRSSLSTAESAVSAAESTARTAAGAIL